MTISKRKIRLAMASLAIPAFLLAQSDRGTITGTVSDPVNAVVPGAVVIARNVDGGTVHQTVTTATGNFTLPSIPAGPYELIVEASGFKSFNQKGLTIQVAQTARIDVVLQIGATSDSVTVTADAPLLRTESAEQSTNLTGDRMNALPLNFGAAGSGNVRNPWFFAGLTPGATNVPGSNTQIRVNGSPNTTFKTMVDGQDITSSIDPSHVSEQQPSVEAIQELSLQTSNFAAEYGQVAGGLFNFTTKSGSNQFHGSAYEFLTNEALNAGLPFTNDGQGNLTRVRDRRHDFGFSVGGPVLIPKLYDGRNKTFFFFNLETYIERKIVSGTFATLPTEAYRNGDFSAALTGRTLATDPLGRPIPENAIYDPATTRTENGARIRDIFPGNVIPLSRMDPVALKIQQLIPAPHRAGNVNNWEQIVPRPKTQHIPSIKLDHNIGAKTKVNFYWSLYSADVISPAIPDALPEPLTAMRVRALRSYTYRATFDHSFTPTFLIHGGVGYVRHHNPDSGLASSFNYDAVAGLGLNAALDKGFPRITGLNAAQGGMSLGIGPSNGNLYYNDKPTAVLSATNIRGNHTIKFGGEWRIDVWTDRNISGTTGNFAFNAQQTALPSTQGQNLQGGAVGFPYASFLLGLSNTASIRNAQDPQLRKRGLGLYIQDTWKVTRKLTLDYGLRWDNETAPREIWNRTAVFAPTVANPAAGGLLGATAYEGYGPGRCECLFTKTYPWAFGPRIGAAYQINSKTVLRAGWGVTYGTTTNYNYITGTGIIGVGWNQFDFTTPSFGDPAAVLRMGLNYNAAALGAASYDPGIRPSPGQINTPPYWLDPQGGRPPRIHQWNVSLQREITKDLVVEAAYVGNRGAWFQANGMVDVNALSTGRIQALGLDLNNATHRSLLTARLDSAAAQAAGFRAPYAGYSLANTVAQSLRPYPQFGTIGSRWVPQGNTWYDSLQVKATKRYSHGLDATFAFTWQKELNLGAQSGLNSGEAINDVFNRQNQKTLSSSSIPLMVVTGFNYRTPAFGPSKWMRGVVGGWTVGGILRYQSGLPILVPAAQTNLTSLLFRNTFANRVPGQPLFLKDLDCHCIDPNKDFVLNPAAWSAPALGQFGTAAAYYNDYRYVRRPTESLSFGRIFRIKESMNFQVRAEFFNVFNRTYMNDPDSTNASQTQVRNAQGVPTAGFGRINAGVQPMGYNPRSGQIVMRFQW